MFFIICATRPYIASGLGPLYRLVSHRKAPILHSMKNTASKGQWFHTSVGHTAYLSLSNRKTRKTVTPISTHKSTISSSKRAFHITFSFNTSILDTQ